MNTLEVWNIGELFASGGIDHHYVCAAGYEEAVSSGIISKVVPATFTADRKLLLYGELIGRSEGRER